LPTGVRALYFLIVASLVAVSASATTTFLSPLEGAQVIGPSFIEVTTDAKNIDRIEFSVDGAMAGVARTPPYRIAHDFGTTLTPRAISATVWSDHFRTREIATIETAAMTAGSTIDIDLVEVPLRVKSAKTLRAADLRVSENGVEQSLRDVTQTRPPAHFAFVIDRSLSMDDGKLDAALSAVSSALTQLREGDRASLVFFNHYVAKARPIARGENLRALAQDIVPSGGTSLRDAIASVSGADRTYALAITDGGDRNSALTDEEALRRISTTKTVVSSIVLGSSHVRFLDRAAENTGGSVRDATKQTLASTLESLLADINSRYLVVYQSSGTQRGWRAIDVKPRNPAVTVLRARKGYFAR
jgi:hypothetical protein